MAVVLQPWQILVAALAGWMGRQQDAVIEYLREENRVLKQQLGLGFYEAGRIVLRLAAASPGDALAVGLDFSG